MIREKIGSLFVTSALLFFSPVTLAQEKKQSPEPKDTTTAELSQPLAKADDYVLTLGEGADMMSRYPENEFPDLETRHLFFEAFMLAKLYAFAAKKEGLDEDPAVQERLARVREKVLTDAYYDKYIRNNITEETLRQYHNDHPQEFMRPEQRHVRHILVATQEEARAIKTELMQGAKFAELARQKSMDPETAPKGGDLGWLIEDRTGSEIEKAAFNLQVGQISDAIQTSKGYHIIKVEETVPARRRTFDEARKMALQKLKDHLVSEVKERLMKEWSLSIDEDMVRKAWELSKQLRAKKFPHGMGRR